MRGNTELRFSCPVTSTPPPTGAPLLVCLPGIDGTSHEAAEQMERLGDHFRTETLTIPAGNNSSVDELVEFVERHIRERRRMEVDQAETSMRPPVYLMGEGFGSVLALAVGQSSPEFVDRLIVTNPASSLSDSLFGQAVKNASSDLPDFLWEALFRLPLQSALGRDDDGGAFARLLPAEVLRHRVKLALEFCDLVNSRLHEMEQPVLVLTGGEDALLPSRNEGMRLRREMPDCRWVHFPEGSHALLREGDVDVIAALRDAGLLSTVPESHTAMEESVRKLSNDPTWQSPPASLVGRGKGVVSGMRKVLSPRFFSTRDDGSVEHGLTAIRDERPMLFVGNHELHGIDLFVIMDEFLRGTNMLPRGLAHPIIWSDLSEADQGLRGACAPPLPPEFQGQDENGNDRLRLFFESFGAVPVTGRSLYKLMQSQEAALLFPGGVGEAHKRKGEMYKLKWPEKPEFVRTAMKFGATIVPFGAVGLEDCFNMVLDGEDQKSLPFISDDISNFQANMPAVRGGETLVPPISIPGPPRRLYVSFGKPIRTAGMDATDLDDARLLYQECYDGVRRNIDWLLMMREHDPYDHPLPRLFYETTWEGKQAPTFPLAS